MFKKIKGVIKKPSLAAAAASAGSEGESLNAETGGDGEGVDDGSRHPRGAESKAGTSSSSTATMKKSSSSSSSRNDETDEERRERKSSSRQKSKVEKTTSATSFGAIEEDRDELGEMEGSKRKSSSSRKEKGGDRKSSSSSSSSRSTKKKATDREKKIAMHAKAKCATEMATQMESMSLLQGDEKPQRLLQRGGGGGGGGGGGEPTTPAISQRHYLLSGNNKRQERYDNIYATHQSMVGSFVAPVYEKTDDEVEFLLDALSDNFVFNTLDEVELETLVNAFEHVRYSTGTTIINQGEYGGYFYVLSYGIVAFVVNDVEVGRATCGNSFGELALLYNAPRAATCIVVGDDNDNDNNNSNDNNNTNTNGAGLWRVDQVTFRKLLAAHTIQNDNQTKVVLRKVPFLSDLDDEFIHRIADALTTVYYDAGDTIFARGSEGSVFYVIREGKVQYEHYKRGIKTLRPGDYFGEQAIVKNEARRATATAMKDTIALALSRDIFERVLGPLSDVIQRSNDRRLLGNVPLFANLDIQSFEIELMGALIDDVKYPSEKEILSEGDYVDVPALYLVRSGVLEAYTDAGESRILKAGMYFGEDTLLPDKDLKYGGKGGLKQSAETVEVLEDCVLGKLTLANIDSVILDLSRMGGGKRGRDTLQRSIDIVKLVRHTLLGAGTFGQVWLTSDKKTGNAYALKVQIKRELIDHKQAEGVCRELDVMRKIDHPFIIKLVNTSQDEQSVFMLLNLVQGGELFNIMHNDDRDCIPESEVQFYAAGILEALSYMHRRRIIYRDLKPENVLIDDLGYTVIVDLGFAKVVSDKTYTLCGTPLYLAPEVILSRGHDKCADYWSLGCLIYEMIGGQTPFYDDNIDQITLFKRIVHGRYRFPKFGYSESSQSLITGMLANKVTERLGCLAYAERDIKDHPFMKDINFGKLAKRMIKAPWVPQLTNPLDASCFESWDHMEDKETKGGYEPLSKKEQEIFKEF